MTVWGIVQTMIVLGKMALAAIPKGDKFQVALDAISASLAELEKVTGSDVTKQQLESLRTTAKW